MKQVQDDLADQNRKNITRVARLKEALVLYHHCNDPNLHLKTVEEKIAMSKADSLLKQALVAYEKAKED